MPRTRLPGLEAFDFDYERWFRDTGCPDGKHPSCLTCPLERCRFDHTAEPDDEDGSITVVQPQNNGAQPDDWKRVALDQLDRLLREIAAIGPKHSEAESIHRALTAYGMTDLPALPWKSANPRASKPRGPYKKPEPVTCEACRLQRAPAAMSKRPDGGYVCRVGGCAAQPALKQEG